VAVDEVAADVVAADVYIDIIAADFKSDIVWTPNCWKLLTTAGSS